MKVCIVSFANFNMVPYIHTYTKICNDCNVKYDIIYWDRYGLKEERADCAKLYRYPRMLEDIEPIRKKLFVMLGYANYVKKILKKEKYDKVIILTSLLGVFLESFLTRKYNKKYIFDIRDYSFEHITWYKKKMESLMTNSILNVISSPGFKSFLPQKESVTDHNCSFEKVSDDKFKKRTRYPIKIAFIGNIRYRNECTKFLEKIKNNEKLEFHFYGRGEILPFMKAYCKENNYKNVFFYGEYKPEEKESIIQKSDLLFNAYGTSVELKFALSNKYYESMYYKKPLIVNPDTIMAEFSEGTAFKVDYECNVADELIKWYENINEEKFDVLADRYLKIAIEENTDAHSCIRNTILM